MNFSQLLHYDAELSDRMRLTSEKGLLWKTAGFLAHSGDSWFWLAGLGVIWLFANPDWRYRSVVLAAAIIIQACTVLAVKFLVRRRRPEGDWGAVYRNTDPHSFPSGHATRAALLATMGWLLGPDWLGWALTMWAPFVSLARVTMGVHYLSDVLAGVIIGILIALALMNLQMPQILMMIFPFLF